MRDHCRRIVDVARDGWLSRHCSQRVGVRDHDRRDKTVSASRQCLDKPRCCRLVDEDTPDLADAGVYRRVEVDESVFRPERRADLFACHDLAGAVREQVQDLRRLRRR